LSDGRGADQPWLQETPDPMVTASWDTWVEINPATAARLGVKANDLVKVISAHSEIVATVYLYPAISPEVIGVPLGQGHSAYGRYATDVGANVLAILTATSSAGGAWAWGATRVKLEPLPGRTHVLPVIEDSAGVNFARTASRLPG
jgi:anaerobic selenocysteine-containing dehydrogenase